MKIFKIFLGLVVLGAVVAVVISLAGRSSEINIAPENSTGNIQSISGESEALAEIPVAKTIPTTYHTFQTFNNCAPAALSMALSYFGIRESQESLAADLRPYNNLKGVNDDKSTTPDELGGKAEEYGLKPYFRVNGSIDILKKFIANDLPVVMRTLLEADEDFAHYRVVKGYDEEKGVIIQDDSYQGKNTKYSYEEFMEIWKPFGYEYLVLAPADKIEIVESILGEEVDEKVSWRNAVDRAERELLADSADDLARFNLSVALYYVGDYEGSVREFEKVESKLSRLTLWYQMEPIRAYAKLGNHARVMAISDKILNGGNPAYSELYILRGEGYVAQGNLEEAKKEFEKAVFYNKNLKEAQEALASVSGG